MERWEFYSSWPQTHPHVRAFEVDTASRMWVPFLQHLHPSSRTSPVHSLGQRYGPQTHNVEALTSNVITFGDKSFSRELRFSKVIGWEPSLIG